MPQDLWTAVDTYFADKLLPPDPALDAALEASAAADLPRIAVTPHQGKFLNLLAKIAGARSILEIGTLGGYSTIWLARALAPGGSLVTLEAVAKHAEVARANLAKAGLAEVVDIRVGPALDTLPTLTGPFDLVFVDADKQNNPHYFQWAVRLAKPGTVIVVDNVVRQGAVANATSEDEAVQGVRALHDVIEAEPRAEATALQTVGAKGYDGFTIVRIAK
ncbi:O-methyltransferase [Amycolatopsis sp. CA-230715]|uniref:O-methyltransferase n=1 Tax=Amycolatopsis sp. CA-230715 TaxID=2745196 RepID=UPI001C00AE5E|nr:O-methyltransferase [Amycolatopsis sp. CA-230715]QWF78091.1 Protein-L-isoaspartate O-methyltransferase [Amycolatopsis sp. CA-230715]